MVLHLGDAIEPVAFTQLSMTDLESVVVNTVRCESSAIIPEGSLNAFNTLVSEHCECWRE